MPKDAVLNGQTLSANESGQVLVPREEFINNAELTREGSDLNITTESGETLVVQGYFDAETAPDIVSPDGGFLSADLVQSFLTPTHAGQYANAATVTVIDETPAGQMVDVLGDVYITRADGTKILAESGTIILQGDTIEASEDGAANMVFADNSSFAVSEGARLSVDEYIYDSQTQSGSSFFSMLKGAFVYTSGVIGKNDPENVNIETPVGSIGIRGTVVMGHIKPAGQDSEITIIDGAVVVSNAAGLVELNDTYETVRLDGYNSQGETSQVDESYLVETYNFDDSFEGYSYDSLGTSQSSPSSETPTEDNGSDGGGDPADEHGESLEQQAPDTQTAGTDGDGNAEQQTQADNNPLVEQMIQLQLQEQGLQETAGDEFVDTVGGGDPAADLGAGSGGGTGTGGTTGGGGTGDTTPPADTAGPNILTAQSLWFTNNALDNPVSIRQYESTGFKVGHIEAQDASGPVTYNILSGNTDGAFSVTSNGDILVINDEAIGTYPGFTLDIEVSDSLGNTTVLSNLDINVDILTPPRNAPTGQTTGNDTLFDGAGADLVWGDDGDDLIITSATNVQDVFLGGRGSDVFIINDLNFELIDGGFVASGALIDENIINASGGTGVAGDEVQLGAAIGTVDITGGGANVNQFEGIDSLGFFGTGGQTINLDTDGVRQVTDPALSGENKLHIWGANGGAAGQFNVNLNGEFDLFDTIGNNTVWRSNVDSSVVVVVHETAANEVNVS